jgi:uncharacterized protein with PQ loop repeat
MPLTALIFLIIAATLSITAGGLMIRKSVTAKTSDGLSTGLITLGLLLGPMWLAYGFGNQNIPQIVSSLIWVIVYTLWWGYWFTDRKKPFWIPLTIMTIFTLLLITLALTPDFPWRMFGWIGGILGVISNIPQLIKAFTTDHRGDGFSMRGWIANTASITSWVLYAIFYGDTPVLVTNSITLTLMILIVIRTRTLPLHPPTPTSTDTAEPLPKPA